MVAQAFQPVLLQYGLGPGSTKVLSGGSFHRRTIMSMFRKLTLGIVLGAGLMVLFLSVYQLWDFGQQDNPPRPQIAAAGTPKDTSPQLLQDRLELLTKRLGDMEVLVLILLGVSGLYTIVFVVSTNSSAMSFARQADRSVAAIRDQLGRARGDLHELREETTRALRDESKQAAERLEHIHGEARQMVHAAQEAMQSRVPTYANLEQGLAAMQHRIAHLTNMQLNEEERLEVLQYENALAGLDLMTAPRLGTMLAGIYLTLGRFYLSRDLMRARFYLKRTLAQAPTDADLVSGTHYDLACVSAQLGNRDLAAQTSDFQNAVDELRAAFQHRSKQLDDWLARDIDEGGMLYELAGTPPFDKAVNDLLLNVSIGSM